MFARVHLIQICRSPLINAPGAALCSKRATEWNNRFRLREGVAPFGRCDIFCRASRTSGALLATSSDELRGHKALIADALKNARPEGLQAVLHGTIGDAQPFCWGESGGRRHGLQADVLLPGFGGGSGVGSRMTLTPACRARMAMPVSPVKMTTGDVVERQLRELALVVVRSEVVNDGRKPTVVREAVRKPLVFMFGFTGIGYQKVRCSDFQVHRDSG